MGTLFGGRSATHNRWDPADKPFIIGGVVLVGAILVVFSYLLGAAAMDVWSGIIVFLVLIALAVPVLRWVARIEGDPWLFQLLYSALIVKLAVSMIRYYVIFVVYAGNGDAGVYHDAGALFARRLRDGVPIHPLPVISSFPRESHWIADLTGSLYTVTSPSAYAGFFVFSALCFGGQVLMVRGLKVAVPEADYRRYAILVLFLPSLLFWPSSIGKEALMLGCLGLVIYGGALLLCPTPKLRGIVWFVLGLSLLSMVRPHIGYMSVGALVVAVAVGALGPAGVAGASGRGRLVRIVALGGLLAAAAVTGTMVSERFADSEGDTQATLDATLAQTSTGGSEFAPLTITSPMDLPLGVPSVLFRPFPWEASSINSLIAAVEGLLLGGLFFAYRRRVWSLPKLLLRRPFLVFVLVYVLVFAMGFSFLANFGILARQRTQMMPMVLVLLALPATARGGPIAGRSRRDEGAREEDDEDATDSVDADAPVLLGARPASADGHPGVERWRS